MLQKWDELQNLQTETIAEIRAEYQKTGKLDREWCEDIILDLLIMSYVFGAEDVVPDPEIVGEEMREAIYKEVAGKDFSERIRIAVEKINAGEPYENPTQPGTETPVIPETDPLWPLLVILFTESHRDYGEGAEDTAIRTKKQFKTWVTMADDRVRDQHRYLEGMTVPIHERFYTYDGDSGRFPGDFEYAWNNISCRCILIYT